MTIFSSILSIFLGFLSLGIALRFGNGDQKIKIRGIISEYNSLNFLYLLIIIEVKRNNLTNVKMLNKKVSEQFIKLIEKLSMFNTNIKPYMLEDDEINKSVFMNDVNINNVYKKNKIANDYLIELLKRNNIDVLRGLDTNQYKIKYKRNFLGVVIGARMIKLKDVKKSDN